MTPPHLLRKERAYTVGDIVRYQHLGMGGAVEVRQRSKETYWLSKAQRRVTEMEAELAAMSPHK